MVALIAALSLKRARRANLYKVLIGVLCVPPLAGLLALLSDRGGLVFFDIVVPVYVRYLVPTLMALQAANSVADEVQGKTLGYLFARPIARWALPAGKYVGMLGVSIVLCAASVVLVYLACMGSQVGGGFGALGRSLAAITLACVHFGAVAVAFGAFVVTYPFVAMLLYVLLVDVALGLIPGGLKVVSMGIHLVNVAGLYQPVTQKLGWSADPQLGVGLSVGIVLGVTLAWLVIAMAFTQSHEYRVSDQ
ncbi:MAG: ABC transporter permease [Myxococcales bacterium]|nr:ABC transporter permease [Myxococcales bacterium]